MPNILIIGKGFSELNNFLEERGYKYTVLMDIKKAKHPERKLERRVLCDFSSREKILQAVDSIADSIDGVVTVYESYILPAAWVAEHLGLPGMPPDAAEACSDKWLMRKRFATAPEKISPDFQLVDNEDTLNDFANKHTFPLVLKPANLVKSLLVTKNHSPEELFANYRKARSQIKDIYKKYAPNRQPSLLVEEFLEGSIHSVDAFVDADGEPHVLEQIVDYQTGYDIGFEDNFHYSRILPSKLPAAVQQKLRHSAATGIKALGMKSSPAHIEIIITKEGPRIVEIGARSGGYRSRMHWLANGLDITETALQIALGKKPKIRASKNEHCAALELFPKIPGNFVRLKNKKQLLALPSLKYLSIKAKPGQYVGKAADGYKACAVVLLHHSDEQQFANDLEFVNQYVLVTTE